MIKYISFFLVFTCYSLEFERIAPHNPAPNCSFDADSKSPCIDASNDQSILIPCLQGIRFIQTKDDLAKVLKKGIVFDQVNLPCSLKNLAKEFSCFLNKPLKKKDLLKIKSILYCIYAENYRPFVDVSVPDQDITDGVIQIVIQEAKLGQVSVCNNCYFCEQVFLCPIRSKKDCPINTKLLAEDLNWINLNPFRLANVVFVPSQVEGYTDMNVVVKDCKPLRFFSGVENIGLDLTGHNRWFFGLNHGNVFNQGHLFSYQFTTGTHYDEFWAHSFQYTVPFRWRHLLYVYGGISKIDTLSYGENKNAIAQNQIDRDDLMRTEGMSYQASFRYTMPFCLYKSALDDFSFGFDFKRSDTNLTVFGTPILGQSVNLSQFVLAYNQGNTFSRLEQALTLEVFCSPFEWLPDQSNSDYQTLRYKAQSTYVYFRGAWTPTLCLPFSFRLESIFRGQISSANLLASEQVGLGGYNSVRGYEERQVNMDNAVIANVNLVTPCLPLFSFFTKAKYLNEGLEFVGFFDLGWGANHNLQPEEKSSYLLYSIGPGFRYKLGKNVTVRGDYGLALHSIAGQQVDSMYHFGGVISF